MDNNVAKEEKITDVLLDSTQQLNFNESCCSIKEDPHWTAEESIKIPSFFISVYVGWILFTYFNRTDISQPLNAKVGIEASFYEARCQRDLAKM